MTETRKLPFDAAHRNRRGHLPIFRNNITRDFFTLPTVRAKKVSWDLDRVVEAKRRGDEGPYVDVYVIRPGKQEWDLLHPHEYGCYWVFWEEDKKEEKAS